MSFHDDPFYNIPDYNPGPIKARGELIEPTQQVALTVQFKDPSGNPIDTDSFPTISIVQPSGLVAYYPTSVGVHQIGIGKYEFIYTVGINGDLGVYNDIWTGYINGYLI